MGDYSETQNCVIPAESTENVKNVNGEENCAKNENGEENCLPKLEIRIRPPQRPIVIEPLVFFMAGSFYPLMLVNRLYTYGFFQKEVANERGFNLSDLSSNTTQNCDANRTSPDYIFTQAVQSRNAYFNMFTSLSSSVPALFATLLLSPYSDKAGRRYAILPPVISGFAYALVLFLVIMLEISPWFTLIGYFLEGLGGGYQLLFVGIYSYIADTTSLKNRRFRITLVEIIMMATATTGPIAFGYWINLGGYLWPSLFTVVFRFLNILYAIFFVPETIISTRKPTFFTFSHVSTGVKTFTKYTTDGRRWQLCTLLVAFIICFFASQEMGIDTLFELNDPLCWDSVTMGYYSTTYMAVSAVGGTIVAWTMRYCASDITTAIAAGCMSMAHYVYKGFITKTYQMFLTSGFAMFSILFIPSIRTLMSKLVAISEQGSVFGALALSEVIFGFTGNLAINAIYANTLWISPGFTFIVVGIVYGLGTCVLIGYATRLSFTRNRYVELEPLDDDSEVVQVPPESLDNKLG